MAVELVNVMEALMRCARECAGLCYYCPFLCVVGSSLIFKCLHWLLRYTVPLPVAVETNPWRLWKWRNLSVSLAHSLITGTWAIACVVHSPDIMREMYMLVTPLSYMLVCVSSGYFIQDAADIIFSGYAKGSWEFLLHHVLVLWCFLYAVLWHRYIAGVVVALFVEVNSVFLHTRLMLKLAGVATTSHLYGVIKLLNLSTYVFFRLGAQFYITSYIIANYSLLEHALCLLVTLVMMDVMMLVYLWRLVRADFCSRQNTHDHCSNGKSVKFLKED